METFDAGLAKLAEQLEYRILPASEAMTGGAVHELEKAQQRDKPIEGGSVTVR
ncbi:MAG: hypothetical protein HY735_33990 [Verrucomicrobia bacterium]|nr:hypothetical protein [Verrucomicrobiota bacterium]